MAKVPKSQTIAGTLLSTFIVISFCLFSTLVSDVWLGRSTVFRRRQISWRDLVGEPQINQRARPHLSPSRVRYPKAGTFARFGHGDRVSNPRLSNIHTNFDDFRLLTFVPRSASDAVDGSHPTASQCADTSWIEETTRVRLWRVVGRLPWLGLCGGLGSAGVGQASGEETAGGIRLGGAAGSVYGDLTAAGWLAVGARSSGWQGCGQWRQRRCGFATTFR